MSYKLKIPGILTLIPINVVSSSVTEKDTASSNDNADAPILEDDIKSGLKSLNKGLDTLFHDTIEDIKEQSNAYFPQSKSVTVTDANGKKIKIEIPKNGAGFTYYEPGTYKYSGNSYVPDYQDSVVLSRSIGLVPRLKGEFFMPSENKYLKSQDADYGSPNSSLTSSVSNQQTDNIRNGQLQKDNNKKNQLQTEYSLPKTDEQLEYEDRVAELLAVQTRIQNYAIPAPMNVQAKIPKTIKPKETTTVTTKESKPTLGPSILQKSKKTVFKIGAGSPISKDYLLMTSDQ